MIYQQKSREKKLDLILIIIEHAQRRCWKESLLEK